MEARSLSLRAAGVLQPGVAGRVLAGFARICDLLTDDGEVVALAWGGIGDGPLNIVLEDVPAGWRCAAGQPWRVHGQYLEVGELAVNLAAARPWDARPDWGALAPQHEALWAELARCGGQAWTPERLLEPAGTAVWAAAALVVTTSVVGDSGRPKSSPRRGGPEQFSEWGDERELARALTAMCGLGPGLTPAGDDWLAGWLLGLWLSAGLAGPGQPARLIKQIAARRTTALSRAFLICAAAGEADEHWHALLQGLLTRDSRQVKTAGERIIGQGATSGAAMLAGFQMARGKYSRTRARAASSVVLG